MARKVIIDCDVGVDDALALILAFHSPEIEVQAVTGVNGNVPLDLVFANIQKVLSLVRPSHKPWIARGADRPLTGQGANAHDVHGGNGLGGAVIRDYGKKEWWKSFPRPAQELICETASANPGAVTLITLGPLTNLALALDHDPEAVKALREIVIMGGAVRTRGNITPHAEFNICVDPLAASRVFSIGLPIRLVPLDVTRQVALTPAVLPDLMAMEWTELRVVTEPGERCGKTEEVKNEKPGGGRINVGFKVNAEEFLNLFISRIKE
ncbi:MAG: Inosine/uridine-preferring nucleoside hydrolase [Deltaproteobacteria bacterium]|nr:Inosine/uridine-preferring nucleoside hydrolase [Deltaproteobacteria bacterium]